MLMNTEPTVSWLSPPSWGVRTRAAVEDLSVCHSRDRHHSDYWGAFSFVLTLANVYGV